MVFFSSSQQEEGALISLALQAYKSTFSKPSTLMVVGTPPAQFTTISGYLVPFPLSIYSEYNL
jgi:hypothetical protein